MSLRIDANAEPIPGYRLIERIGGGGFGEVWKAEAPGGLMKAIKVIHGDLRSVDADGSRHAEQELRALKRLQAIRHPYLLSIERYDVIEGRVLIVTELADCNLWDRFRECRTQNLPGIPRSELMRYMEEAAEVLDLMSTKYQLQHLDIKPQNLFLVYSHVKVADFGLVKDFEGVRGQMTGGVTPVYAAPETFDQIVSRFCDQYSLAIVYQELLTGVRPFSGTSGHQLLMQHLREPPNLGPLPPADRPAVARALSKKPEDRFPTCHHFVLALTQSGPDAPAHRAGFSLSSAARAETPVGTRGAPTLPPMGQRSFPDPMPPMETPKTQLNLRRDDSQQCPTSYSMSDIVVPHRAAPPEVTGDGILFPAIVIGLGQCGLDVVRDLRRTVQDRYGSMSRLATLKLVFLDTDSETLHAATADGGLDPTDVVPARLNRAAHYLKPRRNGRSLIEGWFDPQMLYRIPRSPATVGLRALGRLAFLDHYRPFAEKFSAVLEACTRPDALAAADRATRLGPRTNRPRVYIVAGLGGGTGGGMFLDAAYAARHKLRQLGYLEPEVVGVLLVPPAERAAKGPALANAYTALREMNHYARPDTAFAASYEERDGQVNDPAPPFSRTFIVPLPPTPRPGEPVREAGARRAADFLFRDLFTPLGRAADDSRWKQASETPTESEVSVFGQASFVWPQQVLLGRTARWLSASVLSRWIESDPKALEQYVKGWLVQRWQLEDLGADLLVARIQAAGEKAVGQPAEAMFATEALPYAQKGWFSREPEPAKLAHSLNRLQQIVGHPDERAMQRAIGLIEPKLDEAADAVARDYAPKVLRLATTLLEHPDYRLVGAEEVVRQVQEMIEAHLTQYGPTATALGIQAIDSYNCVQHYLTSERGQRRPSAADVAESIRTYPTWRFQSLVLRQVCRILSAVKTQLADQLRELHFCRQRLEEVMRGFGKERQETLPPPERILLPPGVASLDAALTALQSSLGADDMRAFDKKLQVQIESEFNALFNVCLSSANMMGSLQGTIEDQARAFLTTRLGQLNLSQMFFARFPDATTASQALLWLHDQAAPPVKMGPVATSETVILGGPAGADGQHFQQLGHYALPAPPTDYVVTDDEILVYREYAQVPLTSLPQLGPLAEDAYNAALDTTHGSPHSRNDVRTWQDVEVC